MIEDVSLAQLAEEKKRKYEEKQRTVNQMKTEEINKDKE